MALGSHNPDQRSWLVPVTSADSEGCVGPRPVVESPVHSGQPLGEGAGEGQVEDEHRRGRPRWVRRRGGCGGRRGPAPRTDEGGVDGGLNPGPGRDGTQVMSRWRGGRVVGQTLK